jgi:hypothetical protein
MIVVTGGTAIAAARAAGVRHVVKVSAFAASDHSRAPIGRWHYLDVSRYDGLLRRISEPEAIQANPVRRR